MMTVHNDDREVFLDVETISWAAKHQHDYAERGQRSNIAHLQPFSLMHMFACVPTFKVFQPCILE